MLFTTNNSDFFLVYNNLGIGTDSDVLIFLFNRNEITDYSEILSISSQITESEAAELISKGASLQATKNSIVPLKGEAITGAVNATNQP
ncbi:hypothetical protein [Moritella viscosa]|uniref:Uncharacterized protein n=1 Tax=Moritella viscosa TaxID=80854 RepID=A0ABY1HGV6_9GAMM|nr:hypothetical protein [Moritella viscosa]SGY93945.1 Putative uncharacterized protein [Moritella viscosa]SGZ05397.1 Putative uncharacterized protein [Moritella viscosa]SGZ07633.1 Putative uncharacterized protein [Moritella viscosa]SHO26753.1 Putative uncharacterized protein [Moritella viscosa]